MATATASIPATTRMGAVHLTVGDLDRSLRYYGGQVGLGLIRREGGRASLGAGDTELDLVEEPGAAGRTLRGPLPLRPARAGARGSGCAGSPTLRASASAGGDVGPLRQRGDLPHRPRRARDRDLPRPAAREVWEGQVATRLVASRSTSAHCSGARRPRPGRPSTAFRRGRTWGTCILQVADVPESIGFYRDVLGFALMAELMGSAAFLGAGGYHHRRRERLAQPRRPTGARGNGQALACDHRPSRRR